jgi:hypothetical protein
MSTHGSAPHMFEDQERVLPFVGVAEVRLALIGSALLSLLKFDVLARVGGFGAIYQRVAGCAIGPQPRNLELTTETICAAVRRACGYYPRTAACLQRSAAAAWMLRRAGVSAELVIGIKKLPFKSHAWVEVDGVVVNDHPGVNEIYLKLDRCGQASVQRRAVDV